MFSSDRVIAFLIGVGFALFILPWLLSLVGMKGKLGMKSSQA